MTRLVAEIAEEACRLPKQLDSRPSPLVINAPCIPGILRTGYKCARPFFPDGGKGNDRQASGRVRATHHLRVQISDVPADQSSIELGPAAFASVVTPRREDRPLRVERLY